MNAVTHLEKVIVGEVSAVTHLEKVITGETSAVTYTEKVITGEAPPITHLQKVIAGVENPVTHLEHVWAGSTPEPTEHEYTGAVPYTFTANGEPLLDWRISGNTVQSTTPTPQNPVMPNSCGERTGNLCDEDNLNQGYYNTMSPFAFNGDNRYRCFSLNLTAGTYSILVYGSNIPMRLLRISSNSLGIGYVSTDNEPYTFDLTVSETVYISFRNTDTSTDFTGLTVMMKAGNTVLPYEPYGIKIPILSNSTTTPVYFGEVETVRNVKKLVLTGGESYVKDGNATYLYYVYVSHMYHTNCLCSHLKSTTGYPTTQEGCSTYNNAAIIYLNFGSTVMDAQTSGNTVAGLKEYLAAQYAAGTPVTVWYVLSSATTGIVNEPLMKIGDYADEVSNVATIPTNNGSTTIDVDTTVKPSEIYIKYKGV